MDPALRSVLSLLVVCILSITEVLSEICPDGGTCRSPTRCCGHTCCYDEDDLDNTRNHYSYGYRLSIWNMWYFWFVILFVLMSCFGGCGYYKQRQRLLQTRGGSPSFFSSLQSRYSSRRSRSSSSAVTLDPNYNMPYGQTAPPHMNSYPEAVLTPPPYSEVVSQPDLYPVNKIDLPPYPGGDQVITITNEPGQQPSTIGSSISQFPQPPPYSECSNQVPSGLSTANENVAHSTLSANQNALSQECTTNQREASS